MGYTGLKTGTTKTAGPCLSSIWNKNELNLTIIVLNCKSIDERFTDTHKLLEAYKKLE